MDTFKRQIILLGKESLNLLQHLHHL